MYADLNAEHRLLGCVIDQPRLTEQINPLLFTGDRQRIFQAMAQTYGKHGDLAVEGVERRYGQPLPPEIEIARGAKPGSIIEHLTHLATKRQLVDVSNRVTLMLNGSDFERETVLRSLQLPPIHTSEDSSLPGGISNFVGDLQKKRSGTYRFVSTGMGFLDLMMGGEWGRQALTVIMGQAGGGKTAAVCQSSLSMARLGIPSLFVSLEMPKARLISRYVANMASVNGLDLRKGTLTEEEVVRVDTALDELRTLPIYIIDNPEMTADEITYQVRLHKELHGIEAFFVDYLQIVAKSAANGDSVEELGYIAQKFRTVAKQEDIAAIALSQQNRQFSGLQSILGSGRIGHTADTVFEIKLEGGATSDDVRPCMLDFHKNRDGPMGESMCIYRPKYLRFE